MAKNYSLKEAVEIIVAGEDVEQIMDLGRRFPVLAVKIAAVGAKAGESFVDLMSFIPEHVTANKVNSAIKNGIQETEADDEEETTEEAPKKTAKPAKKAEVEEETEDESDYDAMPGKKLYDMCKERGLLAGMKDKKKPALIAALVADDAKGGDTEAESDEEDAETNPYEGKNAMELFKECKKRGIKAAPKKPAKFYADLLTKADLEAGEEEATEDEDWGEEDEEEAPAKKAPVKKEKPVAKKAPAKKEETEDDGDDWDI